MPRIGDKRNAAAADLNEVTGTGAPAPGDRGRSRSDVEAQGIFTPACTGCALRGRWSGCYRVGTVEVGERIVEPPGRGRRDRRARKPFDRSRRPGLVLDGRRERISGFDARWAARPLPRLLLGYRCERELEHGRPVQPGARRRLASVRLD